MEDRITPYLWTTTSSVSAGVLYHTPRCQTHQALMTTVSLGAYDRGNACGQDERCNGIDAAEGNLLNGREDFRTSLNGKLNPR